MSVGKYKPVAQGSVYTIQLARNFSRAVIVKERMQCAKGFLITFLSVQGNDNPNRGEANGLAVGTPSGLLCFSF